MGYGGYNEFRRNQETGEMEEWHIGYTSNKGFTRGRSTGDYKIRTVSPAEWAEIEAENARIDAERTAERQARAGVAAEWDNYLAALPTEIEGLRRGHCGRAWEMEDSNGNYVLSIPKKAAVENWPLGVLSAWLDAKTAGGYGE